MQIAPDNQIDAREPENVAPSLRSSTSTLGPVISSVIRLKFDGQMFQPDETRNNELLVDIGRRGHFPPSERIDLGTHYDLIDQRLYYARGGSGSRVARLLHN